MQKKEAYKVLEELINGFEKQIRHIQATYTEEDTKQKLIQPLFGLLGWDFTQDKDVMYERSGGQHKRVDYIFGNRQFYLEAKAASVNPDDFLLQANLYAYNKGKFCVLTNFETFKLIKPIKPVRYRPDMAAVENYDWSYKDYLINFDLLWNTFSKDAVLDNDSLDILLEEEKKKRKFYTIDDDFLNELEGWRKELALEIYLANKKEVGVNSERLTEYTQRILDRIIFSKFLEDRAIEDAILRPLLGSNNIYPKMVQAARVIGRAYNGLIFNSHPVDHISVGDRVLEHILGGLYDTPHNPSFYRFDQIPIEILGSIYERFLGKIIKINPDNQKGVVRTVDKPEVARAKGVYYTPDYIVEYIVENTVANVFEKKSVESVLGIRIIDISCGSGSFLVGAYSYLLNWYLEYYLRFPSKAKKDRAIIDGKLTRSIRKDILVRHIFGVDIDPQACEVAQMSLYLKMLEDCPDLQREIQAYDLILPDLKNNIRCGNSLIGPEYFLHKLIPNANEIDEMRPFDWGKYFPGGFDLVIGNPPYIDSETMTKEYSMLREAIQETYRFTRGNWDIYIAFFERGFGLLRSGGYLSFITPDKWIAKPFGDQFRIGTIKNLKSVFNAGRKVFKRAKVDAIVTVFLKDTTDSVQILEKVGARIKIKRTVKKSKLKSPYAYDSMFSDYLEILEKVEGHTLKLSHFAFCENACATSDAYKLAPFIRNQSNATQRENVLRIINTGTIGKYASKWGEKEMVYLGKRYLRPIVDRREFLEGFPNSYGQKSIKQKIILKGLNLLDACLDIDGYVIPGKTTLMIPSTKIETLKLLSAILNSDLAFFYLKEKNPASSYNLGTTFTKEMINELPIPAIPESVLKELINLVEKILLLKRQRQDADTSRFEEEINAKVNSLYGLDIEQKEILRKWMEE
jgi:type I restriction-modification system DNA methylase subunit